MTNDIRLYIGDELVEFDKIPDINYNWQETDFSNPTITKNSYSKTITVKGTKQNNKIFGHFWNLERYQQYGSNTGVYYNPTYRVPFRLYVDGTLFQKGYVKLQKVKRSTKGVFSYEIGLFGGLGSFMYNLSTNWGKGTTKTLGDLFYYLNNRQVDLDFTIDKTTVKNAWDNIENDASIYSILNFAPMYTGIPNNLDGDKVLINFNGLSGLTKTKTEDNISYGIYGGDYSIGKLDGKIDMFEAKDIRSYLNTPLIRVKSIFDSICRPINNKGEFDDGYQVVLDGDFFNSNNPYYNDAWVTLPQISSLVESTSADATITDFTVVDTNRTPENYFTINYQLPTPITETGSHARLTFKLRALVNTYNTNQTPLVMAYRLQDDTDPVNAVAVQMYAISNTNGGVSEGAETIIGGSLINWYTSPNPWNSFTQADSNTFVPKYQPQYGGISYIENTKWDFDTSTESGHDYVFNEDSGYITLEMDIPVGTANIRVNVQRLNKGDDEQTAAELYPDQVNVEYVAENIFPSTLSPTASSGVLQITSLNDSSNSSIISGKKVTKEKLLSTSYSVAEWLMSYCKMFGLYIHKDTTEDIIYIDTRNNFYKTDEVEDINSLIDYSKEITIVPTNVDAKFYTLTTPLEETDYSKKYSDTWGVTYGMKKINTGYDFDANSKELLKPSFKSAIDARKQSLYFLKPINGINPYVYNGFNYTLYESGQTSGNTIQIDVSKKQISDLYQSQHFSNDAPYYDFMNRVCLEKEQKAAKTENVLVFYRGMESIDSSYGFFLTDDLPIMNVLNNKSCWIMTASEYTLNGDSVGTALTRIPLFSRYWETGNDVITYSMDYGSPRELYVPNLTNNDASNLYSLFYKNYLEDLYDVNTKVIECYVKPKYLLSEENLRQFYWFANSLWRLNKIIDYSPVENRTVKCQFVKIQSLSNMTSEIPSAGPTMTVTLNQYSIVYTGGTIMGTVVTSDGRNWSYLSSDVTGVSVSPTTGRSGDSFTVTIPENEGKVARRITLTFGANELRKTVTIQQEARKLIEITAPSPISAESSSITYSIVTNPAATVRTYRHNDTLNIDELIQTQSYEEGQWDNNQVTIPINNTYSAVTYYLSGITSDEMYSALTTVIQSASAQPESYIIISGYTSYPATANMLTYTVDCYPGANIRIYKGYSQIGSRQVGSGKTENLTVSIEPNTTYSAVTYTIFGSTTDNAKRAEINITQAASAETTLLLTAPTPIPSTQTYISYDIISNAGTYVDLYKDNVLQGSNTHGAGEWRGRTFNIPQNTTANDITFVLSAKTTDNLQSTSVEVVQKGLDQLIITGTSSTIPYNETRINYTVTTYPSANVNIYKNGTLLTGFTYNAGTSASTYTVGANTSMSAITYVISGKTTNNSSTASYTIVQPANTTVSLSATSPIPPAQTYISYGLTANMNTTVYLLKDNVSITSTTLNAGSYTDQRFSVSANNTFQAINYVLSAVTVDSKSATATVVHSGLPEPEKHLTITAPSEITQNTTYIYWSADSYPDATIAFYKNGVQSGSSISIPSGVTSNQSWYVGQNVTYSAVTYTISGITTSGSKTGIATIVQAGVPEPKYIKYADDTSAKTDNYTATASYQNYDLVTNYSSSEINALTIEKASWLTSVSFNQNSNNWYLRVDYPANDDVDVRRGTVEIYSGNTKVLTLSVTQAAGAVRYIVLKGDGVTVPAAATSFTWGYSANTEFNVYFYKNGVQDGSSIKESGDTNNLSYAIPANSSLSPITWVVSGVNSTYGLSDSITITQSASAQSPYFYWGNSGSATTSGGSANATVTSLSCTYRTNGYSNITSGTSDSWITGATFNNGTFTVSFTVNTGSARNGSVTIYGDNASIATFTVSQDAASVTNYFYWGNSGSATTSGGSVNATTTSITCTYRTNYTVLSSATTSSWITGATFNNGTFTAKLAENDTIVNRSGSITIIGNGSNVATFNITQSGATPIVATANLNVENNATDFGYMDVVFTSNGTSVSGTITTTNGGFEFQYPSIWDDMITGTLTIGGTWSTLNPTIRVSIVNEGGSMVYTDIPLSDIAYGETIGFNCLRNATWYFYDKE